MSRAVADLIATYRFQWVGSIICSVFHIIPLIRDHARDCVWGASTERVTYSMKFIFDATHLKMEELDTR